MTHFNVAIAIRYTPHFAKSVGWGIDVGKICKVLGFGAHYPDPKQFVGAVRDWQHKNPPLKADGMIGPKTGRSWR